MDTKYPLHTTTYLPAATLSLEDIRLGDSGSNSPDEDTKPFDMSSYLNYETSQWVSFDQGRATTPTTSPSSAYDPSFEDDYADDKGGCSTPCSSISLHGLKSSSSSSASSFKSRDPEISRLNRRRAQNRQSQKQFRERKQKAYDEVVSQLQDRDHVIASLRSELTILNLTVVSLQREKQNCLDAVVRLCQSMYEYPDMGKSGGGGSVSDGSSNGGQQGHSQQP